MFLKVLVIFCVWRKHKQTHTHTRSIDYQQNRRIVCFSCLQDNFGGRTKKRRRRKYPLPFLLTFFCYHSNRGLIWNVICTNWKSLRALRSSLIKIQLDTIWPKHWFNCKVFLFIWGDCAPQKTKPYSWRTLACRRVVLRIGPLAKQRNSAFNSKRPSLPSGPILSIT